MTGFGLLLGLFAMSGALAADIELARHDAQSPVEVEVGDVLVVRLQGNASTGHAWRHVDDGLGILEQVRAPPRRAPAPAPPARIGGSSEQVWRFRAIKVGDAVLRLDYRRPWLAEEPPARAVAWQVRVR